MIILPWCLKPGTAFSWEGGVGHGFCSCSFLYSQQLSLPRSLSWICWFECRTKNVLFLTTHEHVSKLPTGPTVLEDLGKHHWGVWTMPCIEPAVLCHQENGYQLSPLWASVKWLTKPQAWEDNHSYWMFTLLYIFIKTADKTKVKWLNYLQPPLKKKKNKPILYTQTILSAR